MSELSDQRSLAQELLAREHRLVFGQPALIDLDGHFRARKFVECQVHLARRATAELPLNAIFADSLSHALCSSPIAVTYGDSIPSTIVDQAISGAAHGA